MRRGIQEADREAFSDDAQFWHDVLAEGDLDAVSETVGELLDGKEITETERRTLSIGMIETFIKARERGEARASGGAFTSLDVEPGASLCPLAPVAPAMAPIPTEERHWCLPDDQRLAEDLVARVTIPATRIVFPVSRLVVEVEGGGQQQGRTHGGQRHGVDVRSAIDPRPAAPPRRLHQHTEPTSVLSPRLVASDAFQRRHLPLRAAWPHGS